MEGCPGLGSSLTDRHSVLFKTLKPLIALRSVHTFLSVCLVKQLKCLCKMFTKFAAKFHTHTCCSSSSFIVTLSLIRRKAGARAQFSRCSSRTNAHSETGQMAVCCQNLTLSALSNRSTLPVLVGVLFKTFSLFLNTHRSHQYAASLHRINLSAFIHKYAGILSITDNKMYVSYQNINSYVSHKTKYGATWLLCL